MAGEASGSVSQAQFVQALLRFETCRAAPHGLVLSASHTFDDWTVISLRAPGGSEPCASLEFHPASGLYRRVGSPCRPADPSDRQMVIE